MKWNFIWLSRVQRTLFKGTANEGKDQIKWNEMKFYLAFPSVAYLI